MEIIVHYYCVEPILPMPIPKLPRSQKITHSAYFTYACRIGAQPRGGPPKPCRLALCMYLCFQKLSAEGKNQE